MSNPSQIDQIADRVDRLLMLYEELQRTNALLGAKVQTLTHERDSLVSRLGAARARVDALLERQPEMAAAAAATKKDEECSNLKCKSWDKTTFWAAPRAEMRSC